MTSMIRFAPGADVRRFQRDFDHVFNEVFGSPTGTAWAPRADVYEDDNAYTFLLDVPGVRRDDLQIDYENDTLTISGERQSATLAEGSTTVRTERRAGRFHRVFTLPKQVNTEGIEARYEDGVLTVTVPKAEASKPRRISVN